MADDICIQTSKLQVTLIRDTFSESNYSVYEVSEVKVPFKMIGAKFQRASHADLQIYHLLSKQGNS